MAAATAHRVEVARTTSHEPTSMLARIVAAATGALGLGLGSVGLANAAGEDDLGTVAFPLMFGLAYLVLAVAIWRHGSHDPVRWMWVAASFSVLGFFTGLAVESSIARMLGADWSNPDQYTDVQRVVIEGTSLVVMAAAPIAAIVEGAAALRGRRAGGRPERDTPIEEDLLHV